MHVNTADLGANKLVVAHIADWEGPRHTQKELCEAVLDSGLQHNASRKGLDSQVDKARSATEHGKPHAECVEKYDSVAVEDLRRGLELVRKRWCYAAMLGRGQERANKLSL